MRVGKPAARCRSTAPRQKRIPHATRVRMLTAARIKPLVGTQIGHGENASVVDEHVKLRLFTQDLVDQPSCRNHG